jgi:hypothetical protein
MMTLVVTCAIACGGSREVEIQHAAVPMVNDSVYVRVINDHYSDARVYVVYDSGARYSLGLIVGKTKAPLAPILWQPRRLAFEISFIAAEGLFYSDDLLLEAGDVIQLRIPPNIASSAFFRRGSQ